jgi:hypothetical protein
MVQVLEPWIFELIDQVKGALDLVENDFVEEGLNELVNCEVLLTARLPENEIQYQSLHRHLLYWIALQRAAILSELAYFDEAREILESIQFSLIDFGLLDCGNLEDCFCLEFATSSLEIANVFAALGQFIDAIGCIKGLAGKLPNVHRLEDQNLSQRSRSALLMWGNSLGYDNVDSRLGIQLDDSPEHGASAVKEHHWKFPIPLRGTAYNEFEKGFFREVQEFRKISESEMKSRLHSAKTLCTLARSWTNALSYSEVAQQYFTRFLLFKAKIEIEMNLVDEFNSSMEEIHELLGSTLEQFPNHIYLKLDSAESLCALGTTILYHDFDNDDVMRHGFVYAMNCIASAQSLLEEIRTISVVTQAVALQESLIANIAAISQDMIGQGEKASWFRSRRIVIIRELLRRDPRNDLANRLKENYREMRLAVDSEVENDITNWNWRVVPLQIL